MPTNIVADGDSRITLHFWVELSRLLGIRQRLSTAFQPQTDGQTEHIDQIIEHYIPTFINYEQTNCSQILPMVEYDYNNSITTVTNQSPFYSNYGIHPRTTWLTEHQTDDTTSRYYVHWIAGVHKSCRKAMEESRERMRQYYNICTRSLSEFKIGDMVILNIKNLKKRRPSHKLDQKLHGRFAITRVISPTAVRLTLPTR